ncbi:hypothetical protein L7F22_012223 [Adiantum nelumboides]|nr:hypothetical protein [Adiantum nelumboides]
MRNAGVVYAVKWAILLCELFRRSHFATADDVDVLLEWRQSIQDPHQRLIFWDQYQANPCILAGVICLPDTTYIEMMNLAWNSIQGSIPPELGNLKLLYALHLHKNQLTGPVPQELGGLDLLETFYVYGNELNGTIPTNGIMSKFQTLDVWHDNPGLCGKAINKPC